MAEDLVGPRLPNFSIPLGSALGNWDLLTWRDMLDISRLTGQKSGEILGRLYAVANKPAPKRIYRRTRVGFAADEINRPRIGFTA